MDTDRPPDIVVVAGGAPVAAELVGSVSTSTRVIAADAGVDEALAHGWPVDIAVGDFDSIDTATLARLGDLAAEVRRHSLDKDETDLELALRAAAESAPARVLVIGVEGGRPDHALANLLLLAAPAFSSLEIEVGLDAARGWIVRDEVTGTAAAGTILSVVPLHGAARVSARGVRWPLHREVLAAGTTRGISNQAIGGPFAFEVHDGVALCIQARDPRPRDTEVLS